MRLVIGFCLVAAEVSGCAAIDGERIFARDLAAAIPSFLAVKEETDLGPSPSPGVRRILSRAQLARFAATVGLPADDLPASLCLERQQSSLDPLAVLASLESAAREIFPGEVVRVEMLDYLRYPLPPGALSFRRQGVFGGAGKAPDSPVLWRGSLTTKAKRTLPVWAKVKVLVRRACWSARAEITAGAQPAEEQFVLAQNWLNPFLAVTDCADPREKNVRLRRSLRTGQRLLRSDVSIVPAVRRGESVQASLQIASATLSFDAVAEMDGVDGQSVLIKRDGRRLRARVTGTGAVQVIPGDSK